MAEKILIIVADFPWLSSIGMALVQQRYRVLAAMTGEEGLDLAVREGPDLIVLDPDLPRLEGLELCQRLRAHAVTARVPIIIVTRRDGIADKLAAFKAGADDYVSIPLDLRELVARVRAILRRTSRRRSTPEEGARSGPNGQTASSGRLPQVGGSRLANTHLLAW